MSNVVAMCPSCVRQKQNPPPARYTTASSVVPRFENSESNLSQASLNRDMVRMLELEPGHSIGDLGSGCGITANSFALYGCRVVGFEFHKKSTQVAQKYAVKLGVTGNVE